MIRKDFISKIVDLMINSLGGLLKIEPNVDTVKFVTEFDNLLKEYFKIKSDQLNLLLEADEERDMIFLDEKVKNLQLRMFTNAGLAYLNQNENQKAHFCSQIIDRLQNQHAHVFEFPTPEILTLQSDIQNFRAQLNQIEA